VCSSSSNKRLAEHDAKILFKQLVSGLQYLQSCCILHRDLKLGNLLLTADYKLKIADFGFGVKLQSPNDEHLTQVGTPNYISPEILQNKPHGMKSDLWALGCILYAMIVGQPPFHDAHVDKIFDNISKLDYVIPEEISISARDLIQQLLQPDPKCRITLNEIIRHEFLQTANVNSTNDSLVLTNSKTLKTYPPYTIDKAQTRVNNLPIITRHSPQTSNELQQQNSPITTNNNSDSGNKNNSPQDTKESISSISPIPFVSSANNSPNSKHQQQQQQSPQAEAKEQYVLLQPLNTVRIKPITHVNESSKLQITASGDIIAEFPNKLIMNVSANGTQIECSLANKSKVFTLHSLPQRLCKYYEYLYQIVQIVKSRTPKVTLLSRTWKCILMENYPEDFEMTFYNFQLQLTYFNSVLKLTSLISKAQSSIVELHIPRELIHSNEQQFVQFVLTLAATRNVKIDDLIVSVLVEAWSNLKRCMQLALGANELPLIVNCDDAQSSLNISTSSTGSDKIHNELNATTSSSSDSHDNFQITNTTSSSQEDINNCTEWNVLFQ